MSTERTEKFVNAIACDLEEAGFQQVSGTMLRRTLATAVSAALPLLAEQQVAELPSLPASSAHDPRTGEPLFSESKMRTFAKAALAATGKQQVGEKCLTCSDRGWVGGPTFSDPAEGGMQCPDCNALDAHMKRYEQQVIGVQQPEYIRDVHDVEQGLIRNPKCAPAKKVGEVQGDARAQFEAWNNSLPSLYRYNLNRWSNEAQEYRSRHTRAAFTAWQAALAARQPGAQEPAGHAMFNRHGTLCDFRRFRKDKPYNFTVSDFHEADAHDPDGAPHHGELLCSAPSAQVIDLGQLQRYDLDEGFDHYRGLPKDKGAHLYEDATGEWVKWDDVEALIGQRDAAPGVG